MVNTTQWKIPKIGTKRWNLRENTASSVWEDLIQNYYEKDKITMSCTPCQLNSKWCNCTVGGIPHEQSYSVSVKVEEMLMTAGMDGAFTTRVTTCPIAGKDTDIFSCDWPRNGTTVLTSALCDGVPDCPNRRDEKNCDPNEFFLTFTVLGLFLTSSSVSALIFRQNSPEASASPELSKTETSSTIYAALNVLNQQSQGLEGETSAAQELIKNLSEAEQFELITVSNKVKDEDTKLYQDAVAVVFQTSEQDGNTKELLTKYKQASNASTKTTKGAFKEAENGAIHRLKKRLKCHCNAKLKSAIIILTSIKAWISLLLAEQKDILTIYGIFFFDREVIFGRYVTVDGIQMNQILDFLIAVYVAFAVWELFMCLRCDMPGPHLSGLKRLLKVSPFFVETSLILRILQQKLTSVSLEETISQQLVKDQPDWHLIVDKASRLEESRMAIEELEKRKGTIGVSSCISDILQAACLSSLIFRPDLRFRALFANQHLQKYLGNELELLTMKLLVLWNLTSPCLRVHKVISGYKQGVAGVGGICLLLSIVLNVLPYVINMVILGSTQPFLIPAFLIFNVAVLLLVKICVDKDFRKWKFEEIVNHGLCATFFIVTSKPTPSTLTKDSVREVIFYYGLNLIHWVVSITLYQVFPELLQKCEKMQVPVETQMVIYLVPPLCILLSALFRAAYHMKDAWAFGRQRSCKTIGNALLR